MKSIKLKGITYTIEREGEKKFRVSATDSWAGSSEDKLVDWLIDRDLSTRKAEKLVEDALNEAAGTESEISESE